MLQTACRLCNFKKGEIVTEYKRHIIMDCPGKNAQVQVFEYEGITAIWIGALTEQLVGTRKDDKAIRVMIDSFITGLIASGCKVVSDKCA